MHPHRTMTTTLTGAIRMLPLALLIFAGNLSAERWLILPPRIEGGSAAMPAADLARGMALYLRASRVNEIAGVTEAEACLKEAGVNTAQRVQPESLKQVARSCNAERLLLTRVRLRSDRAEVTSKVYYSEAGQVTDTLTTEGPALLDAVGKNLHERFGRTPHADKGEGADLIVAGDIFGAGYFEWQRLQNDLPQFDAVRTSYCLVDKNGSVQQAFFAGEAAKQREYLKKLRHEGQGDFAINSQMSECLAKGLDAARSSGRRATVLLVVSAHPQSNGAQISARASLRKLARNTRLVVAPASSLDIAAQKFWVQIVRELGDAATLRPMAQHVRVGLSSGQEWHIFRATGRIYELRNANPDRLQGGIAIPEKYSDMASPADLVKLYGLLSGNKVVSSTPPEIYAEPLLQTLRSTYKPGAASGAVLWRVLLEQAGQRYYLSLTANDAQKLAVGEPARIFAELKSSHTRDVLQNSATPLIVMKRADESAAAFELNVSEYIRNPQRYLRQSLAGRSFYIFTGKVLQILPPESDAIEEGF